jgi:hypothetical protein
MFMLSMGVGTDIGFPDVCITPIPSPTGEIPTPIPYPDISMSATSAPMAVNVLVDCMPALNQLSENTVSVGDTTGVQGGVVSHDIDGEAMYIVGCFTILVGGAPAQRLTSVTGQNAMGVLPNAPGMCSTPSQITVLSLG